MESDLEPKCGWDAEVKPARSLILVAGLWLLFVSFYASLHFGANPLPCKSERMPDKTAIDFGMIWFTAWSVSLVGLWFALLWGFITALTIIVKFGATISSKLVYTALIPSAITGLITARLLLHMDVGGPHARCWFTAIYENNHIPVDDWTLATNIAALVVVSAIVWSLVCIANKPANLTADSVSVRMYFLQISLYGGAAILMMSIIETFILFNWGASLNVNVANDKIMVRVLTLAAGSIFTMLLVALYAPVSLIQRSWRDAILLEEMKNNGNFNVSNWLGVYGLSASPWKTGIAMISPLVTGALVEIIKRSIEKHP